MVYPPSILARLPTNLRSIVLDYAHSNRERFKDVLFQIKTINHNHNSCSKCLNYQCFECKRGEIGPNGMVCYPSMFLHALLFFSPRWNQRPYVLLVFLQLLLNAHMPQLSPPMQLQLQVLWRCLQRLYSSQKRLLRPCSTYRYRRRWRVSNRSHEANKIKIKRHEFFIFNIPS